MSLLGYIIYRSLVPECVLCLETQFGDAIPNVFIHPSINGLLCTPGKPSCSTSKDTLVCGFVTAQVMCRRVGKLMTTSPMVQIKATIFRQFEGIRSARATGNLILCGVIA
ncbi:hypothetical protein X801_06381 [Opisthorchis viverrini]|uniref:Uncharacterized protein n=1 Tax=Opisthorchis viverrini TaxID=6198 RepID=A0A1S8WTL5_OPIVI|nr:hypothetical protein X801_06381 [Opisthorchis viverrini]